jgi:hypothetical protein
MIAPPVVLFDGVCNLCNAWVRFVVRHDPAGIFRFAAQQSPIGQEMIAKHLSGSRRPGRGLACCGLFPARCAMLAIALSFGIAINGLGGPIRAKCRLRTLWARFIG